MIITEYLKGRKPDQLIQLFKDQHVDLVVDVRDNNFYPIYYREQAFAEVCRKAGIDFVYLYELGNPSWNRPPQCTDFQLAKTNYLKHLDVRKTLIKQYLDLWQLINYNVICLICMCPTLDIQFCHRFWLQEYLETKVKEQVR
jgi:uncharacterized protein (DUF488 family)